MRGRNAIGIALRHPDGSIVSTAEPLNSILHRNRFARAPFFRGLVLLYETLVIGTRWLMRSGSVQAEGEGQELGKGTIALTLIVTLGMAIGLFVLLPLFLAGAATTAVAGPGQTLLAHLVEGLIRVVIFVGYLLLVSRFGDIQRTFQYHGAEHMTIHALEHEDPLTVEAVRNYPTAHQRCGTEFLVIFIILSILMFSLLAGQDLVLAWGGHIATRGDWGANNAAVSISGSPYHTRLLDLDGSWLTSRRGFVLCDPLRLRNTTRRRLCSLDRRYNLRRRLTGRQCYLARRRSALEILPEIITDFITTAAGG